MVNGTFLLPGQLGKSCRANMVNKTLLPPLRTPCETSNHLKNRDFPTWHGFRSVDWRTAAWESFGGSTDPQTAWEGLSAGSSLRGELPMENALLVGLSRQMMLERQLDVVANNIANVNTTGFKADNSLFEEYLKSGAHEDNFVGRDRARLSFVQDRGTFKRFHARRCRADQEPARHRDRRLRLPGGADRRRRALHPRRRPADQQYRASSSRSSGNPVLGTVRPDRVPADRPRHQHLAGRHHHRAGRQRPHRLDPRQAAAGRHSPTRRNC